MSTSIEAADQHQDHPSSNRSKHLIPLDLFHLNANGYTFTWGKETYKYYHIFDPQVKAAVYSSDEEVVAWCQYALGIREQLRRDGFSESKKSLCALLLM